MLFIFGRKRVLPVNINSMNITETEFSTDLNPVRATVAVNLTVIEGKSVPYLYSKAMNEAMSVLNLANIADVANVVDPGVSAVFSKESRYRRVPDVTVQDARGTHGAGRRTSARCPSVTGTFPHTVDGRRPARPAGVHLLRQPLQCWRICDANPEFLSPLALARRRSRGHHPLPGDAARRRQPPWSTLLRRSPLGGVERVRSSTRCS